MTRKAVVTESTEPEKKTAYPALAPSVEEAADEPWHLSAEGLADIAFIWACDDIAEIEIEAEKCSQDATAALESLYRHMTQAERLWAKVRVLRSQVEVICPEYRTVDESVRTSRECLESLELLR